MAAPVRITRGPTSLGLVSAATGTILLLGCSASPGSTSISGRVIDAAGRPLAGCSVTATGLEGQSVNEVAGITDDAGEFGYPLQSRGRYRILVTCAEDRVGDADVDAGAEDIEIVISAG